MTIIPEGYASQLTLRETEVAIKRVKDFIQVKLAQALNLTRVSAPLFVRRKPALTTICPARSGRFPLASRRWGALGARSSIPSPNGSVWLWTNMVSAPAKASIRI